ncbi:MAG: YbhB/YbcL family Raf kinase inhibitor-like protein [Dehalococcoidia bacterium]|nr:MAG: YbhB/YbcL family Raf kinase inhibitor-like protein [Dehalococcoidia bacterium]
MSLVISSPAFKEGERIPARYTADSQDVSPALAWSGAPAKTSSLALIVHDPDASRPGGFTHWVIFNLPAESKGLSEGMPRRERLESGAIQGKNDSGAAGYMGPAPPPGKPHHYHFKLYALDQPLMLSSNVGRHHVQDATRGHVLAEAELMGLYQR